MLATRPRGVCAWLDVADSLLSKLLLEKDESLAFCKRN